MQDLIEPLNSNVETPQRPFNQLIPLISWGQAGAWADASDSFHPGDAEEWLPCSRACASSSYALRVRGDSMTAPAGEVRTYPEGSLIFVDPERLVVVNGDCVIARLNQIGEVTFKVYRSDGQKQWLQPLNPFHSPMVGEFSIIGTVVGVWRE